MKKYLVAAIISIAIFTSCSFTSNNGKSSSSEDSLVQLTIFYTNDEHGWFQKINDNDGAAGLMGLWKQKEGYDHSENFLVLSGGDMWTGAASSTWFQGESMVQLMNALEYDASAIGNHEFDFSIDILKERLTEMNFPILAANLTYKDSDDIPDFVKPYIIKEVQGIQVGILGLASRSTPYTTFPDNVVDFQFTSYEDAINKYAPEMKNKGADVLIITSHLCEDELERISEVAYKNGITVMGGGHCHQKIAKIYNNVVLLGSGDNMMSYAKVKFTYNKNTSLSSGFSYEVVLNNQNVIDKEITKLVMVWDEKTNQILAEIIGYASEDIKERSPDMQNMICDSWLNSFPNADVAITNSGGIRQDIFKGNITMETMVGLLPFENTIYELELTGEQLLECVDGFLLGGMTNLEGLKFKDGSEVKKNKLYTVLTTNYLYSQSEIKFAQYDDDPYNTGMHYRQPLIDWIKSLNTTIDNPLNNYLDSDKRIEKFVR